MSGFFIRSINIQGKDVETARLELKSGANLITGASDTGKSYLFAAVSYGLGIGEAPKDIPQSIGYDEILIEIIRYKDSKPYTLWRRIGTTAIYVKECELKDFYNKNITYKQLQTTGRLDNENHISSFLLGFMGLKDKKILVSKDKGSTSPVSWKNLMNLTFIPEDQIIKTTSPFYYSVQYKERTMAQSLLHILLSGNDFSDVVEKEDFTVAENQISGKIEFIEYQIKHYGNEKLILLDNTNNHSKEERQKFLNINETLQNNIELAKKLISKKNELLAQKQELHNDLVYKKELLQRFQILEQQYISDADRLNFILETHVISSQLGDTVCPICSSPLEDHTIDHMLEKENFMLAATNELIKTQSNLAGLKETAENLFFEENSLLFEIETVDNNLSEIEDDLDTNFSIKIKELKDELNQYLEFERSDREIVFIDNLITRLAEEKNRLEQLSNSKNQSETDINLVPYSKLVSLCKFIENRLSNWNYEEQVKVDFDSSYNIFDIMISGKSRRSYGKGKRSISFTACLIGLLDYCSFNQTDFSNLIVLDSPLTTFEEKQKDYTGAEKIKAEILKSFFTDIVKLPENSQIIIFDNKIPDPVTLDLIKGNLNLHVFSGIKDQGRQGFFPV